jgi:hypothetical protein
MTARWRGIPHPELYTMINKGPGAAASGPQTSYWNSLTSELAEVDADLNRALGELNANWTGAASDSATTGMTPLQQWAGDAQTGSRVMGISTDDQAEFIATARAEMPKPVEVTTPEPAAWQVVGAAGLAVLGSPGPAAALAAQAVDHEQQEAAKNAAAEKAVDTMNTYESNSTWNRNTLGTFVPPPDVVVATPPPGGGASASGPIGGWIGTVGLPTGSSSTASSSITKPPGSGGSGGGSGTSVAPPPQVGSVPPGGNGPSTHPGTVPVGGTDPSNFLPPPPPPVPGPGPTPGPAPIPGPGPNPPFLGPGPGPVPGPNPQLPGMGPLPGGGSGNAEPNLTNRPNTPFGPRGANPLPSTGFGPEGHGPGGAGGVGGGPGGLNPESGRPSAAAQLGRGGATGIGGVGGPGGEAGAAGSGSGGRGGSGMGGGGSMGGRGGDEDDERFSPDYLLETTDVFGDDRMVSPAVIGEDPNLEEK